jgi:hypothetical protein
MVYNSNYFIVLIILRMKYKWTCPKSSYDKLYRIHLPINRDVVSRYFLNINYTYFLKIKFTKN